MSTFLVLSDVSKALRDLLAAGLAADPQTRGDIGSPSDITLASPRDALAPGAPAANKGKLSLFLYRVEENPYLKNQPMLPTGTPGQLKHPPMSLDLRYMLTPLLNDADKNNIILGRSMQILFDNPIVSGDFTPVQAGASPEARVMLDGQPFEETVRLWTAMTEPYRLSVSYLVRVIALDSSRAVVKAPRVERHHVDLRKITGAGEGA